MIAPTQNSELPIGSCASNNTNSKQVPGTFSILLISSLSPQASAQREKMFMTLFLNQLAGREAV